MKAVTRSEHKRKELIICVLQHIRNLEDLDRIAKLMGFTQDGINFIEEVGPCRMLELIHGDTVRL